MRSTTVAVIYGTVGTGYLTVTDQCAATKTSPDPISGSKSSYIQVDHHNFSNFILESVFF